jgi:flagellar hook protein FlgE
MSFNSFYTGLTGLKAHSSALNVIGANLANLNTVGYKGSRAGFGEIFAQAGSAGVSGAGNPLQIGLGVSLTAVQQQFHQGALQPTEVVTDLALQGNGFFVLRNAQNSTAYYSRAGNFSFNNDGYLVDPNGHRLQAYTEINDSGQVMSSGNLNDVYIPMGLTAQPQATGYFRLDMNLNAEARVDDPATAAINEAEIFSTGVTVYDSLGVEHDLTIVCTPVDTDADGRLDQWDWEARLPAADVAGATTPPDYHVVDTGTMTFDGSGQMTAPVGNITLSIPGWTNGAQAQDVEWQLFDNEGDPAIKSFGAPSALDNFSQDGFGTGRLQALSINDFGLISGVFTNGQTLEIAQIAVANFNNAGGLLKAGNNLFMASLGSGPAAVGEANTGGRGSISARSLELSNVDITEQFTDLIVAERGYQSNSRVITTTDQIMQEALQIKR